MHDPMTLAFQFPPHRHGGPYRAPWVEVWHVDPEVGGNDDSCNWHGFRPHIPDDLRAWLRKEGEDHWVYAIRGVEKWRDTDDGRIVPMPDHYWPGGMTSASALELLYGIWSIIVWRAPRKGGPIYTRHLSRWLHTTETRAGLPHLMEMLTNPTDNLHDLVTRARAGDADGQKAMGDLFVAVYRIMQGATRPWWRHPRWHVHHWSIRVPLIQRLKRFLFSRCATCGKRFPWGYAPISSSWHGPGPRWFRGEEDVHHHECVGAGVAEVK